MNTHTSCHSLRLRGLSVLIGSQSVTSISHGTDWPAYTHTHTHTRLLWLELEDNMFRTIYRHAKKHPGVSPPYQ